MEADSYLKDRKLLEWIARILEDRQPPPRRKVKAKQTGKKHNFLLAALVKEISLKFNLNPTRNAEAKVAQSACDAVSIAINKLPNGAVRQTNPSISIHLMGMSMRSLKSATR